MGVFHVFKLYKWYQIAQNITYINMHILIMRYVPYSLIFKLKDSKDSKDSNSVCYNKYIHNQRKEVNKNHFLSYVTYISVALRKISE